MDIASQPTTINPSLDSTADISEARGSRLRGALLAGTIVAILIGLGGAFLVAQAAWVHGSPSPSIARAFVDNVARPALVDPVPLDDPSVAVPSEPAAYLTVWASVPGTTVAVDGESRGLAGDEIAVEPGQHIVRVEASGYRLWQRSIDLDVDEHFSQDVDLGASWVDAARDGTVSPLAIIVENELHARPQAGLDRADVVYEALAEGGITRFLAVYASQGADVIGPVRSARDYFVEWAHEYTAPLVHIGASPQGYEALAATGTLDLDEIRGQPGFWRSAERQAPHNAYTSTTGARAGLGSRASLKGSYSGLQYAEQPLARNGAVGTEATIRFGAWRYSAGWTFDPVSNEYLRDMEDEPHLDAVTGEQLRATNVLLQWVESWLIPGDTAGRLQFASVGSGRVVALVGGVAIEGRWQKDAPETPTQYFKADGTPLLLSPGPTWIEIVPPDGSVTF